MRLLCLRKCLLRNVGLWLLMLIVIRRALTGAAIMKRLLLGIVVTIFVVGAAIEVALEMFRRVIPPAAIHAAALAFHARNVRVLRLSGHNYAVIMFCVL